MPDPRDTPAVDDALLEALGETRARRTRWLVLTAALSAVMAALVVMLFWFREPSTGEVVVTSGDSIVRVAPATQGHAAFWAAVIAGTVLAGLGVAGLRALRRRPSGSVIGRIADITTVGKFAEALWNEDRYVRTEAEEALIAMLPRLKAGDGGLLDDRQRAALHRALRPPKRSREADLAVAIIGALTEIGDARAVPHVARLAEERARGGYQEAVRAYAAERLPVLRERVEAQRLASTLVRPATAPSNGDTLLRPAEAGPSGPVEQLVRPASAPDKRP
jgi:hypothetical protein